MGIDFARPEFTPSTPRTWPPLLTIAQAARILNISPWTLRQWDKKSKLIALRVGNRRDRRYKKEDILKIMQEGI